MNKVKITRDSAGAARGVEVKLSDAQVLELEQHRRFCRNCSESCDGCIRVARCFAAAALIEKFIASKGCP